MLKKVVFAAVLALGFVTSFKVGASVDTVGQGVSCEDDFNCGRCSPFGC